MAASRHAAAEVLNMGSKAANAYQRPDLARRMADSRRRLTDPSFNVLVVGEFKQGKSTLINALLAAQICPVDDDVATAVPTAISYSEQPSAALVFAADDDSAPVREPIDIANVATYVTEAGNPGNERHLRAVEVGIPRDLLQGGLVLVDTPGVGGLGSVHTATTVGALPMAEAVLFVSDASQEYSEPELSFLRTARDLCPNVACVLTKVDFYPHWRLISDLDAKHLQEARMQAAIMPVSSSLRERALEEQSQDLNAESGFPTLINHLHSVVADGDAIAIRSAAAAAVSVAQQLEAQFGAERQALADPERRQALITSLQTAREHSDRLRTQAARWQQTLSDGIGDLMSDIDHDLRYRMREMLREADDSIDNGDPADVWDEFEQWVYRRATQDVTENYTMLQTRSAELTTRVAEHFDLAQREVTLSLDHGAPLEAFAQVRASAGAKLEHMTISAQSLSLLRGSYINVLMFGMFSQLAGLIMINPLSIGLGLLLGRRALKEEKNRQLNARRAQAKNAVRKYVDDVSFFVGKDSRDTTRMIHRELRDWFTEKAEELYRSTSEALQAAQQAATTDEQQRQSRLVDVDAELQRIAALKSAAIDLAPDLVLAV